MHVLASTILLAVYLLHISTGICTDPSVSQHSESLIHGDVHCHCRDVISIPAS
jgi:hypothetical protein